MFPSGNNNIRYYQSFFLNLRYAIHEIRTSLSSTKTKIVQVKIWMF